MLWEYNFLDAIQAVFSCDLMDSVMVFITTLSNGGAIWICVALILLLIPKYRRWGLTLGIVLAIGAISNSLILKPLIARPRPFEVFEMMQLLIPAPTDFSFMSGHTLASVSSATVLTRMDKRVGIPATVLAILTAFSLLYLYVHFPTDVLAGAIFGIILAQVFVRIICKKEDEH